MNRKDLTPIILIFLLALFGVWLFLFTEPIISGQTYNENATVNTTVNITNSAPIVTEVVLQDPIDLTAYDNTTVFCNVTVFDYDNDTVTVNATVFHDSVSADSPDDNNNHYSNSSCTQTGKFNEQMNFSCTVDVYYWANNGTWYCNATALDDDSAVGTNQSLSSTLNSLIAILVPGIIDYGDLAQGQISSDVLANITNAGNVDSNISVEGWGAQRDDGWAMNCTFGHIDIQWERYNSSANSGYTDMNQLSTNLDMIPNFYVPQRESETQESINSTYWKLQIPVGAGGVCKGKVLFSAEYRGK